MHARLLLALSLAVTGAAAQAQPSYEESLDRGVQAFRSARYTEAVSNFERACALRPASVEAHLYLGTAFMTQWIPGVDSPENAAFRSRAQAEFERVMELDPRNLTALQSLASMSYQDALPARDPALKQHKLDQAAAFYQRILEVNPQAKDACYSLGVIAWAKFYPELMAARARLGMRPEDPGPLKDFNSRQDLQARLGRVVQEGIENLQKALEIDPAYDDAMAYLNLLIRERADLRATAEEYKLDVETADRWVQKALETKRMKAGAGSSSFPPPPPPPPGAGDNLQRIRVGDAVQSSNLITKVDPIYPPLAKQARVQGTVRFQALIGKDGRLQHLQLVSGHPLLVPAATEAVKQWVYRPTLLNGEPVEVITTIDLPFVLRQ